MEDEFRKKTIDTIILLLSELTDQEFLEIVNLRASNMTSKKCYVCNKYVPLSLMATDKSNPDGKSSICKACASKRGVEDYREKIRHKHDPKDIVNKIIPYYSEKSGFKKCLRCNQIKSNLEFHKDRETYDGLSTWCNNCKYENDVLYRKHRVLTIQENKQGYKVCALCKQNKTFSEFDKNTSAVDGLYSWCKPCKSQKSRVYRQSNKQKNYLLTNSHE